MVSEAAVLQALRAIRDPEAQQDIVALGLVRDVRITEADVSFTLAFTAQSPQAKATIHSMASRLVSQLPGVDRKSTRLNSSHVAISYAVFCLKKKKITSPIMTYYNVGQVATSTSALTTVATHH